MTFVFNQSVKDVSRISIAEVKALMAKKAVILVDVRDKASFAAGHMPGAMNIVFDDIPNYIDTLGKQNRLVVTYCA